MCRVDQVLLQALWITNIECVKLSCVFSLINGFYWFCMIVIVSLCGKIVQLEFVQQ